MSDDDLTPVSNVLPFVAQAPPKRLAGGRMPKGDPATIKRMHELVEIRKAKAAERRARAEAHAAATGGTRGRLRPLSDREIRERALQTAADLFDDARQKAVDLLTKQIDHKDPSVAQRAAVKVLEYTDGKPNQPVTARTENVTKVVYETAAIPAAAFIPGFGLDDDAEQTA